MNKKMQMVLSYIFVILQYLCDEFVIINNIFYKKICKKGWEGGKEKISYPFLRCKRNLIIIII